MTKLLLLVNYLFLIPLTSNAISLKRIQEIILRKNINLYTQIVLGDINMLIMITINVIRYAPLLLCYKLYITFSILWI